MHRQLTLLGLFYASSNKLKEAEDLYTQAILKLENENNRCWSLVMAKFMLGRLLSQNPERKAEGLAHL